MMVKLYQMWSISEKGALKQNQRIGVKGGFGQGDCGSKIKSTALDPWRNGLKLETSYKLMFSLI